MEPIVQPSAPKTPASRLKATGSPGSLIKNQPANGMIISLGMGIQALSMVIKAMTPGHCIAE